MLLDSRSGPSSLARARMLGRGGLAAALLALVALAPASGAAPLGAPTCNKPGRFISQPHFLAMRLPSFPDADYPYDNQLTGSNRNVVSSDYGMGRSFHAAVADASSVFVSANGGCDWTTAYSLPQVVDSDGNSGALLLGVDKIIDVAVSKQPGSRDLYVDVEGPNAKGQDARLLVSHNNGAAFVTHQLSGLVSARPVTSPVEPKVAYVLGSESDSSKHQLWRTADAGDHWTQVTAPPGVTWGASPQMGFVVDPQVPRRAWAYTHSGTSTDVGTVFRSDDGGKTWKQVGHVGTSIRFFSVWYVGGRPVLATAPTNGQATTTDPSTGLQTKLPYFDVELSTNGGQAWRQLKLPLQVPASAVSQGAIVAIVQPTAPKNLVSVVFGFQPDPNDKNGIVRVLTLTGSTWRTSAQLGWSDAGSNQGPSAPVMPSSVGAWWLDYANLSANWLFRYSREP